MGCPIGGRTANQNIGCVSLLNTFLVSVRTSVQKSSTGASQNIPLSVRKTFNTSSKLLLFLLHFVLLPSGTPIKGILLQFTNVMRGFQ